MIFTAASELPADATVLGVPVFADLTTPDGGGARVDAAFLAAAGFEGKVGQTERLARHRRLDRRGRRRRPGRVGRRRFAARSRRRLRPGRREGQGRRRHPDRGAGTTGGRHRGPGGGRRHRPGRLPLHRPQVDAAATPASKPSPCSEGTGPASSAAAVIAGAVASARDWVNEPPRTMTPRRLAAVASELAFAGGLDVEVWEEGRMAMERLGGLLGVSAGAAEPARLIRLVYEPPAAKGTLALVGKGITFDSGGLSLKTSDGMRTMKDDMGGAAAVLADDGGVARPRRSGAGRRLPVLHGEHAVGHGDARRRRAHRPQRHDRRGAQHRRRGSPGARRRPVAGGRGGPGRRHRRGHPDRRPAGRPRRQGGGPADQRRPPRRAGPRRRPPGGRAGLAPAAVEATTAATWTPRWPT